MRDPGTLRVTLVVGVLWLGAASGAFGADEGPGGRVDIRALYERLRPGMTVQEVAAAANRRHLGATAEPVTSWLIWNRPAGAGVTAVLRAAFRDGRLARVEYEAFGDEYQRLAKGADPAVEVGEEELRRLWRRAWQVARAADECREALDAFHQLVLQLQERLTPAEQQAWVRALELRRAAERERSPVPR